MASLFNTPAIQAIPAASQVLTPNAPVQGSNPSAASMTPSFLGSGDLPNGGAPGGQGNKVKLMGQ